MDVCADSTANAVQATLVNAEPQKPAVAHRTDSSSSQPTEFASHTQQTQQSKRSGDHLQADTSQESDAKRHRLWPATPDLQLQQASTQVAQAQTSDSEIVDSILRTLERFRWLQCTQQGKVSLQHMEQLRAQPLLNQLRMLSLYASSYTAECTASSLFSQIVHTVTQILTGTSWLAQHCGPPSQCRLSHEAQSVLKKLTLNSMLPAHSVPDITAQVVPVDLQPAYILCLAGYPGPRPLQDFAADVMHSMLLDVKQAAQHSQADEKMQEEVRANLELASDFTLRTAKASLLLRTQGAQQPAADVLTAAEPPTASEMVSAAASASAMDCDSMQHHCEAVPCMTPPAASPPVANTLQKADSASVPQHMVKLGSQFHHSMDRFLHTMQAALEQLHSRYKRLPRSCLEVLYAKPLLSQLLILSEYCLNVKPRMNPASYLISLCRFHCDSDATQQLQSRSDETKMPLIGTPLRTLLDDAMQARAVDSRAVQVLIEGAVAVLPGPLHGVAACYAIGLFIQRASGNQALT